MALIKELRLKSKMSQSEFARKYGIPLSTLRKWEQFVSNPPKYVVDLIESSIPINKKDLKIIKSSDNKKFYIDNINKKIFDEKGNSISFVESLDGVIESNLPIYINQVFKDFYEIQDRLNKDLKFDKIEKIQWR